MVNDFSHTHFKYEVNTKIVSHGVGVMNVCHDVKKFL